MGVIVAVLRGAGMEPEEREECMMLVMSGKREGRQSLTRFVGRGSRLQVEDLDFFKREDSSVGVGRSKLENGNMEARAERKQSLESVLLHRWGS